MSQTSTQPVDADDPGLTAYALGELEGPEAARYAALVAESVDLQACVADIQAAAQILTSELAQEPAVPLTAERRSEIAAQARQVQPVATPRKQRFPSYARRVAVVAASIALVPGAWYAFHAAFPKPPYTPSAQMAKLHPGNLPSAVSPDDAVKDHHPAKTSPPATSTTHFASGDYDPQSQGVSRTKPETLIASAETRQRFSELEGDRPAANADFANPTDLPASVSGPVKKSPAVRDPQGESDEQREHSTSLPALGSGSGQGVRKPAPSGSNGSKTGDITAKSVPDHVAMTLRGNKKDVDKALKEIRKLEADAAGAGVGKPTRFDFTEESLDGVKLKVIQKGDKVAKSESGQSSPKSSPEGKPGAQPAETQSVATAKTPAGKTQLGSELQNRHKWTSSDLKPGQGRPSALSPSSGKQNAQSDEYGRKGRESGGKDQKNAVPGLNITRGGKPVSSINEGIEYSALSKVAGGPEAKRSGSDPYTPIAAEPKPAKPDTSKPNASKPESEGRTKLELEGREVALGEIDRLNRLPDLAERDLKRNELIKKEGLGWDNKELPWQEWNGQVGDEAYNPIFENSFISPAAEPLSTFSIDVDSASYANMRRFLQQGQLPPPDAVRIEELVNYFAYQYPQPQDGRPFSVQTDIAACPWQPGHQLVRIGLKGKEIPKEQRPPTNLVFLVDVSGSMSAQNKLPLVRESLTTLVKQLDERDKIAIVTYAGEAGLRLPSTSVAQRETILTAISSLVAGGSTNGAAGINTAYDIAAKEFLEKGTNRVILCTDGDFNVGVTSDDALVQMIQTRAKGGVFLSIFGFGMGNLKDAKLEQLADKGNGQYGYIDDTQEANKVFVQELMGTLVTIAKDVKIQIDFNKEAVLAYRLVGYENRVMAAEDFSNDKKDAGEIGSGHTVTALYQIVPVKDLKANNETRWLTVKLRYKQPEAATSVLFENPLVGQPGQLKLASSDFQFAAGVAATGMLLRHSQYAGQANWGLVKELAQSGLSFDPHGHRRGFLSLVGQAESLMGQLRPASPPQPDSTVRGKYKSLLRRLNAPEDTDKYGQFNDFGYSDTKTWAGAENLPAGYWVYVAPHWYIWAETTQKAEK